jgi:hypothetical protein
MSRDGLELTGEDVAYARQLAGRFADGGPVRTADMAAHLMATGLDRIDGESELVDQYRIRTARAMGRVWLEHTDPERWQRA